MPGKLAVFVEGLTERIFVERLLREIAGHNKIEIQHSETAGRAPGRERFVQRIIARAKETGAPYYALLIQSGVDERVVSDLRDNYTSLVDAGYDDIIAIRDVYPNRREDIENMERAIKEMLPSAPVDPAVILAVMETEAWFWAEHTHFERIDPRLSYDRLQEEFSFDPREIDPEETLAHPAAELGRAYGLVGQKYRKHQNEIERTVYCLDFDRMYLEMRERPMRLAQLLDRLDAFFTVAGK